MGLGSRRERRNRPCARVREKNVDVPMLLLHGRVEPIQIFQARYVAYDRRNVSSDEGCGRLQLFLSSPGDHDMRAFFHEALGRGQPDPAAAARYDGDLIFQLFHSPSSFVAWGPGMVPRRGQSCASPPSTASSLAVMKLLSDDARKAAAAPISAGSPMRWSAVIEP